MAVLIRHLYEAGVLASTVYPGNHGIIRFGITDTYLSKTGCGSVKGNELKTPGYPLGYPSNMDCNYSVPIPPGKEIAVFFADFSLPGYPDSPCSL